MNVKINSGILGVIATASVVSYLGMNQGDIIPQALQGQVTSSAGSSNTGACNALGCINGGNQFCAQSGKTCMISPTLPCFTCVTAGSSVSSAGSSTPSASTTDLFVSQAGPSIIQLTAGAPVLVTYSIRTTNGGSAVAKGTQLIFPLPENAVLSSSAGGLGCTTYQSNIVCSIGDLGQGGSVATTLSLNFSTPASCTDTTFQPKAFVWSHTVETNLTNNISGGTLTKVACPPADLSVTKTGPGVAKIGDTIVYRVSVKNKGAGPAGNVTVTDTIPTGFTYVPSLSSPFCTQNGGTIVCNNGNLASQIETSMSLAFLISPAAACGTVNNTVVTRTTSADSNSVNDTYTAPMSVTCPANLSFVVDGPTSQTFSSDTVDAVLARVTATPSKPVKLKNMYFAVQGSVGTMGLGDGSAFTHINQVIRNVELRNAVTGGVMAATPLTDPLSRVSTQAKTYQIFKVSNLDINTATTWEIRADFIPNGSTNHPKAGDTFRALICVEPSSATPDAGCTFSGLITPETQVYNLKAEQIDNGSAVNILPGGTIAGNFHNIENAARLDVAVKSIGTSDSAVSNQKNINLFRFEARSNAHGQGYTMLSASKFIAQQGSLLNAQNYSLWVDTNADGNVDTILQKGVAAMSNLVNFDNLSGGGYIVPANTSVIFEVHADIAASLVNNTLQLGFALGGADYITIDTEVKELKRVSTNGTCPYTECDIFVTTTPSKIWTIAKQGNLFITKAATPVRSRQLLGGTLGDEVLRLTLRGDSEDINVTGLQLSTWDSTGVSVDRLELYKIGETTPFAFASIAGCGSTPVLTVNPANAKAIRTFCAVMQAQQLNVPLNQQVDILVRPRLKTDVDGAISGESLKFWLPKNAGTVTARGLVSSNNLANNDEDNLVEGEIFVGVSSAAPSTDIVGNANQTVLSKITSIVNAAAATGTIPTGTNPIGQFRFTASPNTNSRNGLNKAQLTNIIFTVTSSNVAFDKTSFKLYNSLDQSTTSPCTVVDDSGFSPYYVACWNIASSNVNSTIDPGASTTFVLQANITNPNVTGSSSFQVSLDRFADITPNGVSSSLSHVSWQDKDTVATTFYWIESSETTVKSTLLTR